MNHLEIKRLNGFVKNYRQGKYETKLKIQREKKITNDCIMHNRDNQTVKLIEVIIRLSRPLSWLE